MKHKILIVDDALFMRMRIKKILSGLDLEIIEASDGEEGCDLFSTTQPELVILDISMPIMNGLDALEKMRQINADIPVIMCSAIGQESQVVKAIDLGAKEFITKPFSDEHIVRTVKNFLKA